MSKFKVGERARFVGDQDIAPEDQDLVGNQCVVVSLAGLNPPFHHIEGCFYYEITCAGRRGFVAETTLRKLLPESDTYHPADISIDDLMRTIKTPETVT